MEAPVDVSRPGLPTLPLARADQAAAPRTILELIAEVMEASFSLLGEGVLLGAMPRYLERFGAKNARFMEGKYVECEPGAGAVSALTPLNFVSRVTGTRFEMPHATKDHAVKRLLDCEFESAFRDKSDFAKAMVCRLHAAVYQGSVNGRIDEPRDGGYDVNVRTRILFGDRHCDFDIQSRAPRDPVPDVEGPTQTIPSQQEMTDESTHFYTAILVAFVDFLCTVLPEERVRLLLADCANRVGGKAGPLIARETGSTGAAGLVADALQRSGRKAEAAPGVLRVTHCPFARPIVGQTKDHDEATARTIRAASCLVCTEFLQGVAEAGGGQPEVRRTRCMTLGDDDCLFEVQP